MRNDYALQCWSKGPVGMQQIRRTGYHVPYLIKLWDPVHGWRFGVHHFAVRLRGGSTCNDCDTVQGWRSAEDPCAVMPTGMADGQTVGL